MKEQVDYLLFKCMFDALVRQYWREDISAEAYHQRINSISQTKFFGFGNYDPFPGKGKNARYDPYPKNLKSEFLKHPQILKLLVKYHDGFGESFWDRLQRDTSTGKIRDSYPKMKEEELAEYQKVIEIAGITEAMFLHMAENFNNKTLRDWYAKFVKGEAIFEQKAGKSIDKRNLTIYAIYGGFRSLDQLKEATAKKRRIFQKKRQDRTIYFTGYYYDPEKHDIFEKLALTLEISSTTVIAAEINGNHTYSGKAEVIENTLYINLANSETSHHLYLILHINQIDDLKDQSSIRGALMGISKGDILSSELLLVQSSINISEEQLLNIKRYLYWHRRTFRTKRIPFLLSEMKVRNHGVDHVDHVAGIWKLWHFDEKFRISESLLRISRDYKMEYFSLSSTLKLVRERCSFDVSKDANGNTILHSTIYPRDSQEARGFLIIRVPKEKSMSVTDGLMIDNKNGNEFPAYRAVSMSRPAYGDGHLNDLLSSDHQFKVNLKRELKLYTQQEIISKLIEKRDESFTKIFNQLLRKDLDHTPPHWVLSFLDYSAYFSGER